MNYDQHQYILAAVDSLREAKNWTGKTHVQKTLFLAQAVLFGELPFQFVLFKHGPYSFEVDEELEEMISYDAIRVIPQGPYGPSLKPDEGRRFPDNEGGASRNGIVAIEKIAVFVGKRGVVALEALATAVWIREREGIRDQQSITNRLRVLKPHLDESVAALGVTDSIKLSQLAIN